ncbi:MAG: tetratricopeptide repeat protein [Rhizobacter sp.]|nr:tetratricopeptide repeat protein [Rhizobacter sp.]
MPILALVHLAIAAFFAVHAVRNGRPNYWLMVLFAFPALGSLVYFFAEYLPDIRHTRTGRNAARVMQGLVDPQRELRLAAAEFDRTPTAYNRAQLARALLAKGQLEDAIAHYREAASGAYAKDVSFLKGLAIAELEAGQHAEAVATLERLFAASPEHKTGDLALMYAEALHGAGRPEAAQAFEVVIATDGTLEARCKYGLFQKQRGNLTTARQAFEHVLADAKRGNVHSRDMNREWIAAAKQALTEMESAAR